jgi:trehalose 6-phosphate synthase
VRAYEASAREVLGPDAPVGPTFAASLGPDVDALREVAAGEEARAELARLDELVGDRQVIMRSDRIEPSKNIVRGFMAFDRLLEARPGLRERVVFVAMVYPSRQSLPEYCAYANEVEQIVDRVNDRWATGDWVPIVLDDRDDFARSIAAMQRYDVLLVNPLRDGLNLVAKEGPLLNRRDGTVCLSPEAGAYEELADAVLPVHPYDIDDQAGAMAEALALPVDERADRASRLRLQAAARTPADWLGDLVAAAGP